MGVVLLCIDECSDNWLGELGVVSSHSNRNGSSQLSSLDLKCHFKTVFSATFELRSDIKAMDVALAYGHKLTHAFHTHKYLSKHTFGEKYLRPILMIHIGHTHTHMQTTEHKSFHIADTLERINIAENLALSLTQRESREKRSFVLGVAVGIDRFNQQGLGFVEQEETQAGG